MMAAVGLCACESAYILRLYGNTVARGEKQLKVCQTQLQRGQHASLTKLQLQMELFGTAGIILLSVLSF